ncbi:MAG: ABC transporter substrate-binding protein [Acidobacteriota bacterium]|nr:ABC transporter substrate-binding protein [Acidobacteriota bacterium]
MSQSQTCLRVGVENTLTSLSPDLWTSLTDMQIGRQIYQGLITYDHKMKITPALAESWQVGDSGREWRFRLRPSVFFHDEQPVNAEAALWNMEHRVIWLSGLYAFIEKIFINDELSFTIRLRRAYAPLLDLLAGPAAVFVSPQEAKIGKEKVRAGTGAFKFERRGRGDAVILRRAPRGWSNKPRSAGVARIEFVPKLNGVEMWESLIQGRLDLIYECPYQVLHDKSDGHLFVKNSCPSLSVNMMHFNMASGPFASRSLRNIVAEAVDKRELFEKGNEGLGCVADGPISPASSFYVRRGKVASSESSKPSRLAARRPAAQKFELLTNEGYNPLWLGLFQQQMARAGLECRIVTAPFNEVYSRLRSGDYEAALMGMAGSGDPDTLLFDAFHSRGAINLSGVANKELDAVLEKARREIDIEKRKQLYLVARDLITHIRPALFLRHGLSILVHHKSLVGVTPHPDNYLRLEEAAFRPRN